MREARGKCSYKETSCIRVKMVMKTVPGTLKIFLKKSMTGTISYFNQNLFLISSPVRCLLIRYFGEFNLMKIFLFLKFYEKIKLLFITIFFLACYSFELCWKILKYQILYVNDVLKSSMFSLVCWSMWNPYSWMGFYDGVHLSQDYRAPTRREFTFYHLVPRSYRYSSGQPRKDQGLSQLWSHPVVLNLGPLNWEFSALTTRP